MQLWLNDVWPWASVLSVLCLIGLAFCALFRSYYHAYKCRIGQFLTMFGLFVGFLAVAITILSLLLSDADSALATQRHNCIMYELALQRNANPDLPNVTIDPAWHDLECYLTR